MIEKAEKTKAQQFGYFDIAPSAEQEQKAPNSAFIFIHFPGAFQHLNPQSISLFQDVKSKDHVVWCCFKNFSLQWNKNQSKF